jgi:hypothetical protein
MHPGLAATIPEGAVLNVVEPLEYGITALFLLGIPSDKWLIVTSATLLFNAGCEKI